MSDNDQGIAELRAEIESLKKQLVENKAGDEQRHREIKELQKQHHQEKLPWKKVGAVGTISTPLAVFLPMIVGFLKKDKNNSGSKGDDLARIAEIIRESKKS